MVGESGVSKEHGSPDKKRIAFTGSTASQGTQSPCRGMRWALGSGGVAPFGSALHIVSRLKAVRMNVPL